MKRTVTSRARKPLGPVAQAGLVAAAVAALALGLFWTASTFRGQTPARPTQVNVLELWNQGSYDEILSSGTEELKRSPLDAPTLVFMGFAAFHKGVAEVSAEKKLPLINQAVVSLRKALLLPNVPLLPEIHYILGKAYFHKGKFYADEAISHLLQARTLGYAASDMNEYLGLAYSVLGRFQEASEYFLSAVAKNPSDLLLWTLGQTYYQMQKNDEAVTYLRQSIAKTKDRSLEQRCRFLLGEIFTKTKAYTEAAAEYNVILDRNPNSADAHFFLGEIALAQGNKDAARAEWRKAFKIDPLHFNANQRLFN